MLIVSGSGKPARTFVLNFPSHWSEVMNARLILALWLFGATSSSIALPGDPGLAKVQLPQPPTLMERVREWEIETPFVDVDTFRRPGGDHGLVYQVIVAAMADPQSYWESARKILEGLAADGETHRVVFVIRQVERCAVCPSAETDHRARGLAFTIAAYPVVQRSD